MSDLSDIDFTDAVSGFQPVEGVFLVEVVNAEVKRTDPTKVGVKLTYELLEHRPGLKVTEYFNLKHPKPANPGKASVEQIGKGQFKDRCLDMGLPDSAANSVDTIGKKLYVKIQTEKSKELNPFTNEPYLNSVVKGSYSITKYEAKNQSATNKDEPKIDDDNIPF